MDIMSNMDAARFKSANTAAFKKQTETGKKPTKEENKTPMVIRNLNNQ